MEGKRLAALVATMTVLHGLVIWLVPMPWRASSVDPSVMTLEVVLKSAASFVGPSPTAPPTEQPTAPRPSPSSGHAGELKADELEADEAEEGGPNLPRQRMLAERIIPKAPLDLELPEGWEAPPAAREDELTAAFRPSFFEKLQARRDEQTRSSLLGQRRTARDGLPADAYNAIDTDSTHLKTAAGCFELRSDIAGRIIADDGMALRWWRTACKGVFESPFAQDELEVDAHGKAVGR